MKRQREIISLAFVTVRNRTGSPKPEEYYDGNRGTMAAGVCEVLFTPYSMPGLNDLTESIPFYIPDEKIELNRITDICLDSFFEEISTFSDSDNGNLVLYLHGYNIDFEKGCRRSALFQRALGLEERLLFFSWPADGNMLKYTWDEADLVWSVPYIAEFLERVTELIGKRNLDVVAHSLGARGIVQALVRLSYREYDTPLLDELVLIAPDIDTGIFEHELSQLHKVSKRITVYVSDNDKALRLSQEVHGYPRLGQAGEQLKILAGIDFIDISSIGTRRISGHLYHLFNPEVIEDLTELLHSGKSPQQRSRLQQADQNGLPYWRMEPHP